MRRVLLTLNAVATLRSDTTTWSPLASLVELQSLLELSYVRHIGFLQLHPVWGDGCPCRFFAAPQLPAAFLCHYNARAYILSQVSMMFFHALHLLVLSFY